MTNELLAEISLLKEKIEMLVKERDAAIEQIKAITNSDCTFCKWREGTLCTNTEVLEAGECSDRFNKWEWRGVQE